MLSLSRNLLIIGVLILSSCSPFSAQKPSLRDSRTLSQEEYKESIVRLLEKAHDDYQAGHKKEAIAVLKKILALHPDNGELFAILGEMQALDGDHTSAINNFTRAIELNYINDEVYNSRAASLIDIQKNQEAHKDLDTSIELYPNSRISYYNRGTLLALEGKYKEAIQDFSKAIKIKPEDSKSYNSRGAAREKLGQKEKAIEDYTQAIKINPQNSMALSNRGFLYLESEEFDKAIQDLEKSIQFDFSNTDSHYNLGLAYYLSGKPKDALKHFENAASQFKAQGDKSAYELTAELIRDIKN